MLLEVVAPELATQTTNLQLSDLIYCFAIYNTNHVNKICPVLAFQSSYSIVAPFLRRAPSHSTFRSQSEYREQY